MKIILIYITNPTKQVALKLAKHLLRRRLIACANIFPITSLYWWQKKIVNDREFVLLAKTRETMFSRVKSEVEKLHPHKVPCIVKLTGVTSKKYFTWLNGELK